MHLVSRHARSRFYPLFFRRFLALSLWIFFLIVTTFLIPSLVYWYFRDCFVITFLPDHVEVRDRRDIAWVRWGVPALAIPYAALGGFYVNRNALFAILDGVPTKLYLRWPMHHKFDLQALELILNTAAGNYCANIISPTPESNQHAKITSSRSTFACFPREHQADPFQEQKGGSQGPNVFNGKLLAPGDTVHYFFELAPAKRAEKYAAKQRGVRLILATGIVVYLAGLLLPPRSTLLAYFGLFGIIGGVVLGYSFVKYFKFFLPLTTLLHWEGSDQALALMTNKIVRLHSNNYYSFYDYHQVEKVKTKKSTLIIAFLEKFPLKFGELPKDCPLEDIKKFITQQSRSRGINK